MSPQEWAWQPLPSCGAENEKKVVEDGGGKYVGLLDAAGSVYKEWGEKNLLPRKIFLCVYTLLNVALFCEVCRARLDRWFSRYPPMLSRPSLPSHPSRNNCQAFVRHRDSEKGKALMGDPFLACITDGLARPCASSSSANGVPVGENALLKRVGAGVWFPWAKGFGQMLNFNCAVMVLPVVRSLVMWLHDRTSMHAPWYLAWVPHVLPLDKNIVFHKASQAREWGVWRGRGEREGDKSV